VDLLFKGVLYTSAIRDATKRDLFLSPSVAVASSSFLYIVGRKADAIQGLALRFLEAGLYRNAGGKAFQVFKALLAALAIKYRDALAQRYPGRGRLRSGKAVEAVDWVIAVMPTGLILEVARDLSQRLGRSYSTTSTSP